jgi:hypothetical protein
MKIRLLPPSIAPTHCLRPLGRRSHRMWGMRGRPHPRGESGYRVSDRLDLRIALGCSCGVLLLTAGRITPA